VKATLATGERVTYYYAWRGGPRMKANPADEHAFLAEFFRLTRDREDTPVSGRFPELLRAYRKSPAYGSLKPSTLHGYDKALDRIEAEFHSLEISAIGEPGARRLFLEWRDTMADTPRTADLTMSVLARILSFAADREMIPRNPLERMGRISAGTRRDTIWSDAQISAFLAKAPPKLQLAMELARWTGQRQGDLLGLTWAAYDGTHLKHRQGKTGRLVRYRVYSELKAVLDAEKACCATLAAKTEQKVSAITILTTSRKNPTPWTSDGFRASWAAACATAKIEGVTFHDLRGTFITLAYRVHHATFREIAEISGHAEKDVETIVRKHYLAGEAVVEKMELANKARSNL
jgi:integrase